MRIITVSEQTVFSQKYAHMICRIYTANQLHTVIMMKPFKILLDIVRACDFFNDWS